MNNHDVPEPHLASFDYTHVLYDPRSTTSEVLALLTLSPILLFASYAALIVWTREITIIIMLLGQLSNEYLNYFIKQYYRIERPRLSHGSGYAFPSSHSQYMGFFAAFLLFHLNARHSFPSHGNRVLDVIPLTAVSCALIAWAGSVAYSRYFLHYHTAGQVVGGLCIGAIYGLLWYYLFEFLPDRNPRSILGTFRYRLLRSHITEWMRIRDGWAVYKDGGHDAEWLVWRSRYNPPVQDKRLQ